MADILQPSSNIGEFTVFELSMAIKRTLEDAYGLVRLRGEISGYRGPHSSGHAYFTLKDDRAKIDAVVWKGVFQNLKFRPEEGLEVIATGRVTTYQNKSNYQIIIEALEPAGIGALMALLEERKKKLRAEGLFDEARKKPLPFWPQVIGLITSPTGAVIRDMLHGFAERFPARVILWPVRVQGETCAREVAAAIRGFNGLAPGAPVPRPDLIIVARGGGSLEDLWGFNEEIAVRAAAESAIPLISAVGHETDWTLIDHVADARAPTPTKAAEWAVPKHSELIARVLECGGRLRLCVRKRIEAWRAGYKSAARGLPRPQDLLGLARQRFDAAGGRLGQALKSYAAASRGRIERWTGRLQPRLLAFKIDRAKDRLQSCGLRAVQAFCRIAEIRRSHWQRRAERLRPGLLLHPAARGRERLQAMAWRGARAFTASVKARRKALDGQDQVLRSLSHRRVLERGFALVRGEDGRMLRRAAEAAAAGAAEIEFADGRVSAHIRPEPAAAAGQGYTAVKTAVRRNNKPAAAKLRNDDQGRLF